MGATADNGSPSSVTQSRFRLAHRASRCITQKFGEGVIVNIEGGGGSARASINFGRNGMKLLDLSIAKLEKVE